MQQNAVETPPITLSPYVFLAISLLCIALLLYVVVCKSIGMLIPAFCKPDFGC